MNIHRDLRPGVTAQFRRDLESLRVFDQAADNHTKFGERPELQISRDRVSSAIVTLGRLAVRPRLPGVVLEILRAMDVYATRHDWEAALFRPAASALADSFVELEHAAGPGPERWSATRSAHALADKLLVYETLRSFCHGWSRPGRASQELARELGVTWLAT